MPETLKDKAAKGLLWGGISSGLQQLFSLVFGVVFARILSQDDYGIIGLLAIFMGIASTIQEGGFTAGLINRKEVRHEDYNAVFWFSFLSGLIIYLILFFCAPLIASFFDEPALIPLSRVFFLWFLIGSMGIAHNALLQKELKAKERAKIDVLALVLSNVIGLLVILRGYGYWGLAVQTVIYSAAATSLKWYYSSFRPAFTFNSQPLKEMFPFSIKLVLTGFVYQINANILSVFLGKLFGKHEVGNYTQGNKWAWMGSTFINNMLLGIAQPVLVEASGDMERQRNVFRKMLRFIAFVSFPAMLGLAFVSRELIVLLITDKWMASVGIMQLVCIWGAFLPVNTLYTQLLFSHGKSGLYLWNAILMGVVQVLLLLCIYPFGIQVMVACFVGVNFLWLPVWHYFAYKLAGIRVWDVLKDLFPYLAITLVVLGATYFATLTVTNLYLLLFLKIGIAAVLYLLIMRASNSVMFRECMGYIKTAFRK